MPKTFAYRLTAVVLVSSLLFDPTTAFAMASPHRAIAQLPADLQYQALSVAALPFLQAPPVTASRFWRYVATGVILAVPAAAVAAEVNGRQSWDVPEIGRLVFGGVVLILLAYQLWKKRQRKPVPPLRLVESPDVNLMSKHQWALDQLKNLRAKNLDARDTTSESLNQIWNYYPKAKRHVFEAMQKNLVSFMDYEEIVGLYDQVLGAYVKAPTESTADEHQRLLTTLETLDRQLHESHIEIRDWLNYGIDRYRGDDLEAYIAREISERLQDLKTGHEKQKRTAVAMLEMAQTKSKSSAFTVNHHWFVTMTSLFLTGVAWTILDLGLTSGVGIVVAIFSIGGSRFISQYLDRRVHTYLNTLWTGNSIFLVDAEMIALFREQKYSRTGRDLLNDQLYDALAISHPAFLKAVQNYVFGSSMNRAPHFRYSWYAMMSNYVVRRSARLFGDVIERAIQLRRELSFNKAIEIAQRRVQRPTDYYFEPGEIDKANRIEMRKDVDLVLEKLEKLSDARLVTPEFIEWFAADKADARWISGVIHNLGLAVKDAYPPIPTEAVQWLQFQIKTDMTGDPETANQLARAAQSIDRIPLMGAAPAAILYLKDAIYESVLGKKPYTLHQVLHRTRTLLPLIHDKVIDVFDEEERINLFLDTLPTKVSATFEIQETPSPRWRVVRFSHLESGTYEEFADMLGFPPLNGPAQGAEYFIVMKGESVASVGRKSIRPVTVKEVEGIIERQNRDKSPTFNLPSYRTIIDHLPVRSRDIVERPDMGELFLTPENPFPVELVPHGKPPDTYLVVKDIPGRIQVTFATDQKIIAPKPVKMSELSNRHRGPTVHQHLALMAVGLVVPSPFWSPLLVIAGFLGLLGSSWPRFATPKQMNFRASSA